ncbi:MAG TPA: ATP-binding protein [Polyangiaceae bacterium]|nr:ATP-binding protein [Polyangiaceae bacterium]
MLPKASPSDRPLPKDTADDPELAGRAPLILWAGVGGAPLCLLFAVQQYWVFGSTPAAVTLVIAGVTLLGALLLSRVSVSLAGHFQMGVLCVAIGTLSYLRGGLIPNVLMWTLVVPPTAVLFGARGILPGIAWAAFILVELVLLHTLMKLGYPGTVARHGNGVAGLSALVVVTTAIAITYDVRRKRHEEQRRKLEELLFQSKKLESVGRLAAGIAHDFNNLLTVIRSHARLLDASVPAEGTAAQDLATIDEAARKGAHLTGQLLAFARRGILRPETFPIDEAVTQVRTLLDRVLPANLQVVVSNEAGARYVTADRQQIEHLLINLALNARDATPNGGNIRVKTGRVQIGSRRPEPGLDLPPGAYVVLEVSDDGAGIAKEVLPHIFEPFFTTKNDKGGTGLGLASAYGIVQRAGGSITVSSELGHGATFRVYLPAASADAASELRPSYTSDSALLLSPAAPCPPVRVVPPATPATILLVEDEPAVRRATSRLLARHGYRILVAEDGARALELGKSHSGEIDLLLTDIVMPELSGYEVARVLRQSRPALRVAYLSGYSNDQEVAEQVGMNLARFIRKPYDPDDLLRQVQELAGSTPL